MINKEKALRYCCEDISQIENYDKATADSQTVWHCHHRKESQYTKQQLIDNNDYWKVPANDLIFLRPEEHVSLHFWECAGSKERRDKISKSSKSNKYCVGKSNFKGHHHTEEAKQKIGHATSLRTGMKSARIRKDIWKHKDKILKLLASGLSDRKIAKLYDCSRTVIANIRSASY